MKTKIIIIISILVAAALLAGGFLLFNAPSTEEEIIENILEGDVDVDEFKKLVESGDFDLQILQEELKSIAGVNDIKFESSNKIELICYAIEKYSVEMLEPSVPIYVGENKTREYNELGKYRFKIYINDSSPSEKFSEKYKAGTVYDLPGNDDYKFVYTDLPETHATEIYIGSDEQFSVDKQQVDQEEKMKSVIVIPTYNAQ